ncbi:MAG: hypothetical protein ABIT20_26385 [Gemmatimonadaceae bacterium]
MRRRVFAALLLTLMPALARADSVVTLCHTDTQIAPIGVSRNLAWAIAQGGTIRFNCPGGATIRITRTHRILRDTRIEGGGVITLDGGGVNRVGMFWSTDKRIYLALVGLRLTNGGSTKPSPWRIAGGIVEGEVTLFLSHSFITKSAFPIHLRAGSVRIERSELSDNTGVAVRAPTVDVVDRSVFASNSIPIASNGGHITIEHSDILSNRAPIHCSNGELWIRYARVNGNGNSSGTTGGALYVECAASIAESEFAHNTATFGGAIYITGDARTVSLRAVNLHDNTATFFGGAIYAEFWGKDLALALRHVSFVDNQARQGGAIEFEGAMGSNRTITGGAVAFVRNRVERYGGAIHMTNSGMKLSRGIFVANSARQGGGAIAAFQQGHHTVELANSLVVKNLSDTGGAFRGNAAKFINSTIADNGAGAVWALPATVPPPGTGPAPTSFPIRFINTIVANDFSSPCSMTIASTPYENLGNNLQFPGSSCGAGIATSYPALGPYYVPLFFSQAVNGGNLTVCEAAPVARKDVYDVRRPMRTSCAIGAVEGNVSHIINRKVGREFRAGTYSSGRR